MATIKTHFFNFSVLSVLYTSIFKALTIRQFYFYHPLFATSQATIYHLTFKFFTEKFVLLKKKPYLCSSKKRLSS